MAHDILIVDDEADIRMLIAGVLTAEGYATRAAGHSGEGLAAIQARQPRADQRCAGLGQGGCRAPAARALSPGSGTLCPGQLRDDASGSARDRAVRLRGEQQWGVAEGRHLRARAWWDLVPRRGRRYA